MDQFTSRKKLHVLDTPARPTVMITSPSEPAEPTRATINERGDNANKRILLYGVAVLIALSATFGAWLFYGNTTKTIHTKTSIVPDSVLKSVEYKIYYPNQVKLPNGYTFDKNSFSTPVKNGVSYAVTYPSNKKLVFSLQPKPSDAEMQSFKANFIPLRNEVRTNFGQADIGAYNQQTLVSLPINDGPWIVITAPSDINQDDLKKVLDSLIV